jgi:urease accessory protein
VHPPGGVAGGDSLTLTVDVGAGASALLTTPGATKWYRCDGRSARQLVEVTLAAGASAEWLPQESIFFDGADAELRCLVRMAPGSAYLGWEVLCLGRRASGERFAHGQLRLATELWREGQRVWVERGRLAGDDPLMRSPVGLAGHSVVATLLAAGDGQGDEVLAACRSVEAGRGARAGVTRLPGQPRLPGLPGLPGLVIARWLGDSSEQARQYLTQLWMLLRPPLLQRAAVPPRIWAT